MAETPEDRHRVLSQPEQEEPELWAEEVHAAVMEVFARDGWDDPRMDVYDALDPRRRP